MSKKRLYDALEQEESTAKDAGFLSLLKSDEPDQEAAPKKEAKTTKPDNKDSEQKTPPKKKKAPKPKTVRTTINITEKHYQLIDDIIYTIKSSGKNKTLEYGDFDMNKTHFWAKAIEALEKETIERYGKVKSDPRRHEQ